jgi:glycosyltransferase involved in cell wall biosynthesis
LDELVAFAAGAEFTAEWICRYMDKNSFDPTQCVVYTYWFDRASLGAGLVGRQRGVSIVSRAHGTDLYEERHRWSYIPCRREALRLVDKLFPDSDKGSRYLMERYPEYSMKIDTARLGVPDPGFVASSSQDGTLRMASCSFLVSLKRIDLLIKGIGDAAKLRPNQPFEWNHFGTGPLQELLERLARDTLPGNVTHNFRGYVSQDHLMQFYRDNPVDVFVNVSETEGTPVAAMEAISCGIPIVATAVGGNPEITTEENGLLLAPDPSTSEIAHALLFFIDSPEAAVSKRKGSRVLWERRYNSERNFAEFVTRLRAVRKGSRSTLDKTDSPAFDRNSSKT